MAEKLCELKKKGGGDGANLVKIVIYRDSYVIIGNNARSLSFLATNSYNTSYPSTQYFANWYIAGSNDLNTWTAILNQNYSTKNSNYNTQKTVNVSGYKYLKFGDGISVHNYQNFANYENMQWS